MRHLCLGVATVGLAAVAIVLDATTATHGDPPLPEKATWSWSGMTPSKAGALISLLCACTVRAGSPTSVTMATSC